VKTFAWNPEKNDLLKVTRGIGFEDGGFSIETGRVLEVFDHPNPTRYPGQMIYAIEIGDHVYLVPFVETANEVFLKIIIPSRKATQRYRSASHD
jgi:hypothetical protein